MTELMLAPAVPEVTVTVSRTVAAPVESLYRWFIETCEHRQWLPALAICARSTVTARSARLDWSDGVVRVHATFLSRTDGRSTVTVQHIRRQQPDQAGRIRELWRDRLDDVQAVLQD